MDTQFSNIYATVIGTIVAVFVIDVMIDTLFGFSPVNFVISLLKKLTK